MKSRLMMKAIGHKVLVLGEVTGFPTGVKNMKGGKFDEGGLSQYMGGMGGASN